MGCDQKQTKPGMYVPQNTGGTLSKNEIHEANLKNKREYLEEALLLLRKAGFPVDFCTDSGRVRIIVSSWEIIQENDELTFFIEGHDVSKSFVNLSIPVGRVGFPHTATAFMQAPESTIAAGQKT